MNQGKLEVIKQEMARVNADILGISKLKWTGMSEFKSGRILDIKNHLHVLMYFKRNPGKTVGAERGHQRAYRLKPQSQKSSQSDHMDHSVV